MSRRAAGPILVLTSLAAACFSGLVADPSSLILDADHPSLDHARPSDEPMVGNDLTRLFLPHHLAIAHTIEREGHLPSWDDRGFGGRPLVGNPQAGLFYPPIWLAWWTRSPSALGWITVGHLLFAGFGAYRLARMLGLGVWASTIAAGCVQASPYVLAQTFEGHYPHVWAACWYPWAFDAAIRLRRGDRRSALALSVAVAATFLAGHPQEGFYLVVALGFWALFRGTAGIVAGRRREVRRFWGAWALAMLLGVGLIGVELIPDALAQPWCLRGARLSAKLASGYHLYPANALQLLSPTALGGPSEYFGHENYWESVTSIGLIPLILAMIAFGWSTDRKGIRGWSILVGASLAFACGRKVGLFAILFEVVPGMDRFRVPARSLFLASLGASMLAGMGVEALRKKADDSRSWSRLTRRSAIASVLILLLVGFGGWLDGRGGLTTDRLTEAGRLLRGLALLAGDRVFLGGLAGSVSLIAIGWYFPTRRRAVAVALGLFALLELGIHGHALIVTTPVARVFGPNPIREALRSARPPGRESTRVRAVDTSYDDLSAIHDGFLKTNVNDSFQIQHAADLYQSLYHLFDDRGRPRECLLASTAQRRLEIRQAVLDRMAVGLLVSDHGLVNARWPLVKSGASDDPTFAVYRNSTALPRAYVVPRAVACRDDASIVAALPEADPRQVVLMPIDPLGTEASDRQPFTRAEWTSTDPDRLVLRVSTEAPGLLVVADTWMPGWSAKVDGQPRPVLRGNRAQRVIPLPQPGRHEVILTYQPPGLTVGVTLTITSVLIWTTLFFASSRRRHPTTSDACH